ncbi:MAG: ABC transporter ATP-binding protein [Bacteroidales bacterium]|jgi:subfamily B ATP-binding cassette protein MsbA|nr:ABC transporter ATP-binding protein/permease [Bacteroidales bacterium]MDD3700700.1 ABC transporter ATP-binding protein [Bacteroidales bacterium]MDY0370385.1 ABC transporter ATP-binding protein [Bacteroidales bacterium]
MKKKQNNFYRILSFAKPFWSYALLNVFFNLLVIVFSLFSLALLVPFLNLLFGTEELVTIKPAFAFNTDALLGYMNYLISRIIISEGHRAALVFICLVLITSFFLRNLARFMASYFMANVRVGSVREMRNAIFSKLLILPLSFYHKNKKGDILTRITNDVQEVEYSIMNYLEMLIRDPITILAFIAFMFSMSPQLTLFVLVILPAAGFIIGRIGRVLKKASRQGQQRMAEMLSTVEESISGLRIIKAFNAIVYSDEKYRDQNRGYARILTKIYRRRDLSSPMSEFLSAAVITIVLWFGGNMVLAENSSLGAADFITYIIIFSQILPPAKSFSQGFYSIQKGMASVERIFEILDAEEVIIEKPDALTVTDFTDKIEYRHVHFSYGHDEVLKDVCLTIDKGKVIAIVGESGGGKSTMVDLLPRFYDVTSGNILLDGHDLRDLKIDGLRSLMGIVTQESILFNDTVYNNIAFGSAHASPEAVIEAAKIANAHHFIMEMAYGYDTTIGDRGSNLSGGQRQRLNIARAVLKNPAILIFDEATSSLDTESERLVQEALAKVMSNRTAIIIAHRLSTVQHADEIIVMQKGQIAERGTHDELLKKAGVYKRLYDLQSFN